MITNEIYFFKNQSSVSTSGPLYNVNDGTLILQVDGNVSNLELLVLGNTDLIDDNFVTLKTINASNYNMSDKITSTGIYWIDINGIRKIKLNLNKITGSVSVKAITKRGLTTDLVARAMAANSASGGITLDDVEAITGELANLNTEDKSNLVNAINEVANSGGSGDTVFFHNVDIDSYSESFKIKMQEVYDTMKMGKTCILVEKFYNNADSGKDSRLFFSPNVSDLDLETYSGNLYFSTPIMFKVGSNFSGTYIQNQVAYYYFRITISTGVVSSIGSITVSQSNNNTLNTNIPVLGTNNITSYTPTSDYNPATKKYVDDTISAKGGDKLHDYNIYTITLDDYNLKGTFPTITDTTTLAKFDEILTDIYKKRISANATHDNAFLIVYSSSDTFIFRISTIQASYCNLYGTYIEEPIDHNGYTCSYQFYITGTLDTTAQTFKTTKIKFNDNSKRVLLTNNALSYTPTGDYNPATKKYVDDSIANAITTTLGGAY